MSPEQVLYMVMVERGMVINDGTMHSLRQAIKDGNVYFFEDEGQPAGFCTWRFIKDDLIVENLCMFSKKGMAKLFTLRDLFHQKYPDLKKVRWFNDNRKEREASYEFKGGVKCQAQK